MLDRFELEQIDYPAILEYTHDFSSDIHLVGINEHPVYSHLKSLNSLATILKCFIFLKGPIDIIMPYDGGENFVISTYPGSLKRPGGLGDILTGVLSVTSHW